MTFPWTRAQRRGQRLQFHAVLQRQMLVLTLGPIVVMAVAGFWYYGRVLEAVARNELRTAAQHSRDELEFFLKVHREAIETLAYGVGEAAARGDESAVGHWVARTQQAHPAFLTMLATDARGRIRCATRRGLESRDGRQLGGRDVSDREYFRRPMASGQTYVSGVFQGRGLGNDLIAAISAPVVGADGRRIGVVEGSLDLRMAPIGHSALEMRPRVVAHDHVGSTVFATGPEVAEWGELRNALRRQAVNQVVQVEAARQSYQAVRYALASAQWEVIAALPSGVVLERARAFHISATGLLLLALGIAWQLAARVARRMSQPLEEITGKLERYELGEEFGRLEGTREAPEEIERIEGELGRMGQRLKESYDKLRAALEERDGANRKLEGLLKELDRKVLERTAELEESERRYALAAKGSNDGIWDWDLRTGRVYYSERWKAMVGLAGDAELNELGSWLRLAHPEDAVRLEWELQRQAIRKQGQFEVEYRLRHKDGTWRWMLCRGAVERGEDGKAQRMAGSQSDVTGTKLGDPLTGLANRLAIVERLQVVIDRGKETGMAAYAVIFLDLDRFKLINDSLGHAAGDEVLLDVAQRLEAGIRRAGHEGALIGRMGGDEFVVVLEGGCPAEVGQAIRLEMKAPFHVGTSVVFASASIGIAQGRLEYHLAEDVLRDADTAMYHAKSSGPGEVAVFDDQMRAHAVERFELESALRQAVDRKEFTLRFQPQVNLHTGRLSGMEVLVRWQHPEWGLVPPGRFIGIAEETGLIQPLGRWILEESCRQMADWVERLGCEDLTISVNLSSKQLAEPELTAQVEGILEATGLSSARLNLELTESAVADERFMAKAKLEDLVRMGIGLELDDFGTGYSSLGQLQKMPFRTLKVDRSFVQTIGTEGEGERLVKSVLQLARSLGMTAVAEGIETEMQARVLAEMGCDFAQGFYFWKPLTAAEMEQVIREKGGRVEDPAASLLALAALGDGEHGEVQPVLEGAH
ncbi:MAG: EAL domain-containing protein [Bryobacterales bacterium]|nr:EAL domain-containing protein [Bryobacterales bacterium]